MAGVSGPIHSGQTLPVVHAEHLASAEGVEVLADAAGSDVLDRPVLLMRDEQLGRDRLPGG
jgi:hypothetical protein